MNTTIVAVLSLLCQAAPQAAKSDPAPVQPMAPAGGVQDTTKVISKEKSAITFYGFLRIDLFHDTGRPQNTEIPIWILSEDDPDEGGRNDFSMSSRLTRLGMDFDGPVVPELGDAKVTGKLEVDFYNLMPGSTANSATSSKSRSFLRLRHAYGKADWGTFNFVFGAREHVIAPLTPTPNNDMVMWGAGNLGDRTPQLRPELKLEGFTLTGMLGVTGAVDQGNLDGNGILDGEASDRPTLQARLGYEIGSWVEKRNINVGVWYHWAQEELDVVAQTTKSLYDSEVYGADLTFPLISGLTLAGEVFWGENADDVRGGNLQGVNLALQREIDVHGGWVELQYQLLSWWKVVGGVATDNPDHDDLSPTGNPATDARDRNVTWYWANRFRFGPLEIGADYLRWRTEFRTSTVDDGVDHRFNLYFAFYF